MLLRHQQGAARRPRELRWRLCHAQTSPSPRFAALFRPERSFQRKDLWKRGPETDLSRNIHRNRSLRNPSEQAGPRDSPITPETGVQKRSSSGVPSVYQAESLVFRCPCSENVRFLPGTLHRDRASGRSSHGRTTMIGWGVNPGRKEFQYRRAGCPWQFHLLPAWKRH